MPDRTQTPLIRSRSVVPLHLETDKSATFVSQPEEDGGRFLYLTFDKQRWEDMERPQQITVSVEPGDKLNEETERYDEQTMVKVLEVLSNVRSDTWTGEEIVEMLQAKGILFRERA